MNDTITVVWVLQWHVMFRFVVTLTTKTKYYAFGPLTRTVHKSVGSALDNSPSFHQPLLTEKRPALVEVKKKIVWFLWWCVFFFDSF